jgi:hypothetical protein
MNLKTKLILAAAALALLSAPASARIEGDEGGASAYPFFNGERAYAPNVNSTRAYASGRIVQPRAAAPRYGQHQHWR